MDRRLLGLGCLAALTTGACAHSDRAGRATTPTSNAPSDGHTAIIFAPDTSAAPSSGPMWGEPIADPADEAAVLRALIAIQLGGASALTGLGSVVVVGPALWDATQSSDRGVSSRGAPTQLHIPIGEGRFQVLEARTFSREERRSLVDSAGFRSLMRGFATGNARAATADERKLLYAMISFEIAGKPVTVVEAGDQRLLACTADGKVMWMDLLSAYNGPGGNTQPRAPTSPEQRAKVVTAARLIEQNPGRNAEHRPEIEEASRILSDAPDINVLICANVASPVAEASPELGAAVIWFLGSGAFIIEHPDKAQDMAAMNAAGLRSVLKAYASARHQGQASVKLLEEAAARERAGKLDAWVAETTRGCAGK